VSAENSKKGTSDKDAPVLRKAWWQRSNASKEKS
jgi:hypothetical protein